MWVRMLDGMLKQFICHGALQITLADGKVLSHGQAGTDPLKIRTTDPDFPRKVLFAADMTLGEGYTDGSLTIEGDRLHDLLGLLIDNLNNGGQNWAYALSRKLTTARRGIDQLNKLAASKSNVARHYDLSNDFYRLWLDRDMQYSCAYFRDPEADSLEIAQAQKKDHIAQKLRIQPGMRVLDIGCGWGGMAMTLARDYGAYVTGVTLSEEQHALANQRVKEAGLEARVKIELKDYRHVTETFDRVVSVGMFEHVGIPNYDTYFSAVRDRLTEDGIALIHTIGHEGVPSGTSPWIQKYIFPGGYVPALSECSPAIQRAGLWTTDVEVLRLHYAFTLRHWFDRFEAVRDKVLAMGKFDENFMRMWKFYLAASEMTFREGRQCVYQFQLARKQTAVPLTRDYLYASEAQDYAELLRRPK